MQLMDFLVMVQLTTIWYHDDYAIIKLNRIFEILNHFPKCGLLDVSMLLCAYGLIQVQLIKS